MYLVLDLVIRLVVHATGATIFSLNNREQINKIICSMVHSLVPENMEFRVLINLSNNTTPHK